jgi:hypothetical protein
MSRYEPLRQYLAGSTATHLPMTFPEIERILGRSLPESSRKHRAWWSNNPTNNVMTRAWLDAGYETAEVDMDAERLVFRRKRGAASPGGSSLPKALASDMDVKSSALEPNTHPPQRRRHPLFGILKGKFTLAPGTDLTQPADPEWGKELFGD